MPPATNTTKDFIHPDAKYKIFFTEPCYTLEDGTVTLKNGKTYPL